MNFFEIFIRLWKLLNKKRKREVIFIFILININSIAEFFSVVSLLPLLTIMVEQEKIYEYKLVNNFVDFFNIDNLNQLLLIVTISFVSITLLSALIKISNSFFTSRFSSLTGYELSSATFEKFLYKDYEKSVVSNSSEKLIITTEFVNDTVTAINQFFQICTSVLIILLISFGLFRINFILTLSLSTSFILVFGLVFYFTRSRLNIYGKVSKQFRQKIIKYVQESNGAMRDIIIDNSQNYFLKKFKEISRTIFIISSRTEFLSASPRYVIESLSISLLALLTYIFSYENKNLIIPVIGTIALGCQRLLPSINIFYNAAVNIKVNYLAIVSVIKILEDKDIKINKNNLSTKFYFNKNILIKNVFFKYLESESYVLNNISFEIKKGEKIGIVGVTGSGKSTLMDIILHLLKPTKGNITIDGIDFYDSKNIEKISNFRSIISHVPQDIFLIDSSFVENIALGVRDEEVDFERLKHVCKCAQISEFIEGCAYSYYSNVGERGSQLSGGQKQRIGIARALYKNSQILVLDEATSALDSITERKVMESIKSFNSNLTIIAIAHRLSTLKDYDRLIYIRNGEIEAIGKPSKILKLLT